MKYKFLGKPDKKFPELVTGKVYELVVETFDGLLARPRIFIPFSCPYSSWETFYQNWQPLALADKAKECEHPNGFNCDMGNKPGEPKYCYHCGESDKPKEEHVCDFGVPNGLQLRCECGKELRMPKIDKPKEEDFRGASKQHPTPLNTKPEIEKFTDSDVVYMCETILGYLDMGRIDEAKQHLENLQHWFIDLPDVDSKLAPDKLSPSLNTKPEIEKIKEALTQWCFFNGKLTGTEARDLLEKITIYLSTKDKKVKSLDNE